MKSRVYSFLSYLCLVALVAAWSVLLIGSVNFARAEDTVHVDRLKSEVLRESLTKKNDGEVSVNDLERAERKLRAAEEQLLLQQSRPAVDEGALKTAAHAGAGAAADSEPAANAAAGAPSVAHKPDAGQGSQITSADVNRAIRVLEEAGALRDTASAEKASGPAAPAIPAQDSQPAKDAPPREVAGAESGSVTTVVASTVRPSLEARNVELTKSLDASQARINELLKQLDETRNRLMIAETQVERLSSIIGTRKPVAAAAAKNLNIVSRNSGGTTVTVDNRGSDSTAAPRQVSASRTEPRNESRTEDDMQIATVIGDKVHLRTGPGKDNSPLMAVSKGTRLAVEMRNGEWYRVIAPTGTRAWISSEMVAFGIGSRSSPTQATRVKGFNSGLENDAVALR